MCRSLIICLDNGLVILPQPVFINLLAGNRLSRKPMVSVYLRSFCVSRYKVGNLTQQPLTEIVLSNKQQQFGLEKITKLTALCRHCEFPVNSVMAVARNIVLFLSKMNPIHIIIYVPLTVISLNKRRLICKPWLAKFGYIHQPLKVE